MNLYFELICILWIVNYTSWTTAADNGTDPSACPAEKFKVTPLGHSKFLITWKSKKDYTKFHFDFKPEANRLWDGSIERFLFEDGWFKINSFPRPLKENTRYKIRVWSHNLESFTSTCNILAKTNPEKYSFPVKPDFKVSMMNELKQFMGGEDGFSYQPRVRIEWLPCGQKEFCEANEIAGDYFSVRYKILNSTQEWRTGEKFMPYKYIFGLLPGKEYEVQVTSVYGNLVTDSDPKVISIKPICNSVQSAKIISLPDSSVFISWTPPKQCQLEKGDWLGYTVFYHVFNDSPFILLNYTIYEKPYQESLYGAEFKNPQGVRYGQSKIMNLTPGTLYTFFIIPRLQGNIFHGSEYRIDYTPQKYEANIKLAKPDFDYKFARLSYDKLNCSVLILWLPCGQTNDCKNMKPGSYFIVKYREGNGEVQEVKEERWERTGSFISIRRNKQYEFWVESVDQSDRVKSESKIIDTSKCEASD